MQTNITEGMKVLVAGRYEGQRPQRATVIEIDGDRALVSLLGTGIKVWRDIARIEAAVS